MTCERCNGSGALGVTRWGRREIPGPVPEDSRRFYEISCPTCHGSGEYPIDEPEEDDDE